MIATGSDSTLELLAGVAADFAAVDPGRARERRDAGGGRLDRGMWDRFAANGWIGIAVPEELGGAGLGPRAVAIVARRLGYAGFPDPFVAAAVLAPQLLAAAAAAAPARRLLEQVLAGEAVCAVGFQGFAGGIGERAVEVTASRGSRLEGRARFLGLADADAYLLVAREGDRVALHLLAADAEGLHAVRERRADGGADVRLELVNVGSEGPVLAAPAAGEALDAALDAARLALSAELVGLTERALEITLDYLRERHQFGKPIGAQQALQHRAVDAWIQARLASAALEAAIAVHEREADPRRRAAAASGAKARAAAAARQVCNEALQLHGAIGFTDEYELGLHINRALALAPWLGTAAEHRRRYAELVPVGAEEAGR